MRAIIDLGSVRHIVRSGARAVSPRRDGRELRVDRAEGIARGGACRDRGSGRRRDSRRDLVVRDFRREKLAADRLKSLGRRSAGMSPK